MDALRQRLLKNDAIRLISYILILQLVFPPLLVGNVYAALVTDPNANVEFQPVINYNSSAPVINIVAPNNNGLSHNKYQDFDIEKEGAVFNNSLVSGNSRLAGQVIANPLFGGRTASIILNEVTGASDSELKGLMEIFGDKANIIIANPNGITCNGCGFINTQRGTLTTGTPDLSQGKLRFDIEGGLIRFEEEGHSYRSFVDELDVLSRYIDVSGDISTKDRLSLVAGRFVFDYSKSMAGGSLTEWVEPKAYDPTKDSGRALAVDGTIFGAMQSGQIDIMGTEQGLGVKVDGYLFAQADDLFIQSAGGLAINNADAVREIKLSAAEDIVIGADLIANLAIKAEAESIATTAETNLIANNVDLNAEKNIDLKGDVKTFTLTTTAQDQNISAKLLVLEALNVNTENKTDFNNAQVVSKSILVDTDELSSNNTEFKSTTIAIDSADTSIIGSTLDVSNLSLNSGETILSSTDIYSDSSTIIAKDWKSTNSIFNTSSLALQTDDLVFDNDEWIFEEGSIIANDVAVIDSDLIAYAATITANSLDSKTSNYLAEALSLTITADLISSGDVWKILPFSIESTTENAGDFTVIANSAEFSTETAITAQNYELTANTATYSNSSASTLNTVHITTGKTTIENNSQVIAANSAILNSGDFKLVGILKADQLELNAAKADIAGQLLASTSAQLTLSDYLNASDLSISVKDFDASFTEGNWTAVTHNSQISNLVATGTLTLNNTQSTVQTSNISANILNTDEETVLSSENLILSIDQKITNNGDLFTSEKLTINAKNLSNSGDIASLKELVVTASSSLTNNQDAQIVSQEQSITTGTFNNYGTVSATGSSVIEYQTLINSGTGNLQAANATFRAKSDTAEFQNYGKQLAQDAIVWSTLGSHAGLYLNEGELVGKNLSFSGLNHFNNTVNGTISAMGINPSDRNTIALDSTQLTQEGVIVADELNINRENFINNGSINADILNANITNEFNNYLTIDVTDTANITASTITNDSKIEARILAINATTLNNSSEIFGSSVTLNIGKLTNNHEISAETLLSISGVNEASNSDKSNVINNSGELVSNGDLNLAANTINNNASATISAIGSGVWLFNSLNNKGKIFVDDTLELGESIENRSGSMTNDGELYAGQIEAYLSDNFQNNAGAKIATYGDILAGSGSLTLNSQSGLINNGSIFINDSIDLTLSDALSNAGIFHVFSKSATTSNIDLNNETLINGSSGEFTVAGSLNVINGSIENQSEATSIVDSSIYKEIIGYDYEEDKYCGEKYLGSCVDDDYKYYQRVTMLYKEGFNTYEKGLISVGGDLVVDKSIKNEGLLNIGNDLTIKENLTNSVNLDDDATEYSLRWKRDVEQKKSAANAYGNKLEAQWLDASTKQITEDHLKEEITFSGSTPQWTGAFDESSTDIFNGTVEGTTENHLIANPNSLGIINVGDTISIAGNVDNQGSIIAATYKQETYMAIAESDKEERPAEATSTLNNGLGGDTLEAAEKEQTPTINLLSFVFSEINPDQLNVASVTGEKTPEQLAGQESLQEQLDKLGLDKTQGDINDGQDTDYNNQAPSLFDLDADILARIIADTEYELSPEYIFDKVDPDRSLDAEPKFFLDPYQEAQAVTQAALQQTGTAFFSPDWSTSADQRKGLYDNTLEYLGTQQNVTLGKALTPMQVKQLEQPMIWYVSMNIGGQNQLVPTVYLPEATLDQITTPSAGTLIADNIDLDVSNFKNTGNIKVANSARIQADVITNQRNVMTFGDDRNYGAIAGTGGNISAGDLALISRTDINNNGGSLTAKDSLLLDAQGDINLNALELNQRLQNGKNVTESTDYLLSQLNAGGDATFKAGGDINSQAAQAKIGGNGIFDASNINLLGVTERDYSKTVTKKKDTFSSSKKTVEIEKLNFVGSDFRVDGNMVMNAENDITMVGTNVDVGKNASIKAGNDITLTAGINTDSYSKDKSGSGVATTSSQQKGHVTETATGTVIKTGESLQIDSDGGNVTILASELNAKENLVLGDMNVKRDENGAPIKDENGQYITEDGSSINNLTIGTVELKDESWNVKASGLKGPLKDLAAVAAFTLSASGLGQVAMAAGLDTEIEVGKTSESRVESTTHATSTITAGETLAIKTDGDFRLEGSEANAKNASIESHSTTITAVENTTITTESESTHTVGATKAALKKDEVTVAGATETKHTETTTTTDTELVKTGLNVSENLAMNSVENIDILGSDVNVGGNAEAKAKTITVAGLKEKTTTEHKEKTETITTSVGVKNAYVDTALAIQAVADAGAAVDAAQSALDQAKRDVKNGKLQANAIGDYEANLAAATTQLTQATLSAAASGAAAAATTGTGGFYATGSAEKTITEKTSTDTEERYIGSSFNVGGDASFDATDSIDIIGSNMDIGGGLALNAKDVTIKAGVEETTSTSSETTRTAGSSYSTNGGASANASGSNTDSDSYSKTHINSTINAGSLTSTSDNLTLSGANVEVAGGIDIDTGNLVIESLQDESSSSSKTEGYSVGAGVSASSMNPSALGANENSSNADSQWVNNQTTLIGGTSGEGDVNISADKTTITGAALASATRNEDGSLTDNNSLNLATDELIIEDIKDKDHSENKGFDISAGLSSSGSSTVGLTSDGHKKEQTTLATLGGGNITKKDGSAHEEELVASANSDLNNSQEITKDMKTGGLNASVTIDHRLVSENGRASIKRDVEDADNHFNDEILGGIKEAIDTGGVVAGAKAIKRKIDIRTGIVEVQTSKNDQVEKGLNDANGDVDAKQQAAQGLSDVLTDKAGVEKQELIVYSDASDKEGGFHSDKENITGINAAKTNMADGSDVAKTTVHETTHHTLNEQENSYSKQNKEDAAHNDGEYAQKVWKQQNERNGHTTGGSGKAWVANNKNSETLKSNTKTAATIPDEEREKLIPPVVVGIGLILGEISSANAPSEEDNLDEIPQSTSILPGDVALDAVSELANEHLPENVAAAVGVAVMVGKDPVKAIANLPETVSDLTKKTDAPKVDTDFEIGGKAKNPSKNEVEVTLEYKTNPKHDREELKRQAVEDQAKGIENMRAGEVKVGIEEYKVSGRPPLAAKTTKKVRKENPEDGRGKAVTHGPDCCMGNKGDKVTGYGGLPENASIGSQNKKNQSVAYDAVKDADPDASVKVKVIVDGEEIY